MSFCHKQTCIGFIKDDDERLLANHSVSCVHLDARLHCMFFVGNPPCDDLEPVKALTLKEVQDAPRPKA